MFDYHVHTSFSADSQEPVISYLQALQERGVDEFCVTEHMAVNFHRGDWMVKLDQYVPTINRLKEEGFPIKLGVEADVSCAREDRPKLTEQLGRYPLDFVLASSHSLGRLDPYMEEFFLGKDPLLLCRAYLGNLLEHLKKIPTEYISALAHVDYLAKGFGAKYLPGGVFRYEYAADEMDALLRFAVSHGKCIEINASSPQSLAGQDAPALNWLRRYRELGGEFVTVGSDAHQAARFGEGLLRAQELAKEAGIRYIASYNQMVPTLHKIP